MPARVCRSSAGELTPLPIAPTLPIFLSGKQAPLTHAPSAQLVSLLALPPAPAYHHASRCALSQHRCKRVCTCFLALPSPAPGSGPPAPAPAFLAGPGHA